MFFAQKFLKKGAGKNFFLKSSSPHFFFFFKISSNLKHQLAIAREGPAVGGGKAFHLVDCDAQALHGGNDAVAEVLGAGFDIGVRGGAAGQRLEVLERLEGFVVPSREGLDERLFGFTGSVGADGELCLERL